MRKVNYGLIVSDFDGTLVNADGTILEKTKERIREYIQAGGIFVISTGRLPMAILNRTSELGIKGVLSCSHGAVIVDIESKELLLEGKIPNETAVKLCRKMEEMGLHIHAHFSWEFYSNMDDPALKRYETIARSKAKVILDRPLSTFLEESGRDVCKMLAIVDKKDNDKIIKALSDEHFENCYITRGGANLVEIINAGYSKGTALQFLANYYGVPIEKTIAIGDQLNDISMIEAAGLGIAVKNAENQLKEKADLVSEYTNEEGAVGKIIEEYGFQK